MWITCGYPVGKLWTACQLVFPYKLAGRLGEGNGMASVEIEGINECLKKFSQLEGDLRKEANRELRAAAKEIALREVMPALPGWASRAPQPRLAAAIAEGARVRSDRMISVRLGSVVPQVSGFKKSRIMKRKKQNMAALAWGSEVGPNGGHTPGSKSGGEGTNFYAGGGRESGGKWIKPNIDEIAPKAVDHYKDALLAIMRKYEIFP